MKKFIVRIVVALVVLCGMGSYIYKTNKIIESYEKQENKESKKELLSMMLETESGSGKYQETMANEWPTDGYIFNSDLSKCENGGTLSWDSTNKKVIMEGNSSDKCYVYFDVYKEPTIADYCSNGDNLSSCIKNFGDQGSEVSNIYIHNSNLTNGAGDGSYRYAGSSETTNNFVCFGYDSTDGTCPTDNLYRIIGVFGDEVKLIKYDYAKSTLLGTDGDYYNTYSGAGFSSSSYGTNKGQNSKSEIGVYYWNNYACNNMWSESRLNTINLNKNYINNIGTKWSEKISDHTWIVGGNTANNIFYETPQRAYQNEINSPATNKTVNAKVGLMYVSDYGYAASTSSWLIELGKYENAIANNWMYMGLNEWTLAPRTDYSNRAFNVDETGYVDDYSYVDVSSYTRGVRPVLYLKSTIGYLSGSGTISSPILIN